MISDETPIAMLTVRDLKEILKIEKTNLQQVEVKQFNHTDTNYVYGLKGIRDLFKVSHATAQKYKNTILKDAVTQHGRKIIVDVEKAMKLFNKAKV